jgi:glycosyltransferase involved in cell wall biosynthesis
MASVVPLSNLIDVLSGISNSIFLITGNEGRRVLETHPHIRGYSLTYVPSQNLLTRIWGHLLLEFKMVYQILRINKGINMYLIFMGEGILLPMLLIKTLRKPALLALAGSSSKILNENRDIFSSPFELIDHINYRLADRIVIYSPGLVEEWGLRRFKDKISVAHEHFLDFQKNKIQKPLKERSNLVGYIGRLSAEKGVLNFVKAIQVILKSQNDVNFIIGGDGQLREEIENFVNENNIQDRVKLSGWISHDELPVFLNRLKLLVLPSYTEGLPNIILEAMACGTPVLATHVGAIPDLIRDEFTGFVMKNNTPDCVANNILRALQHSNLERITQNARDLAESQFTFEKTVAQYKNMLVGSAI